MSNVDDVNFQSPIIGFTGMRWPQKGLAEMHVMDQTQIHYLEAVEKVNGIPMVLPVAQIFNPERIKRQVSLVDAILIQGGIDVTPSFYGEENLPLLDITCAQTDKFILEVIKCGKERKIPIFDYSSQDTKETLYPHLPCCSSLFFFHLDGYSNADWVSVVYHQLNLKPYPLVFCIINI